MKQANFDKIFVIVATIGVVIGLIAGFGLLGSPFKQRQLRADQQRLQDLYQIALEFSEQAIDNDNTVNPTFKLPQSLPENQRKTDPITGKLYDYQRLNNTEYKLCAEFATDSHEQKILVPNEELQEQKFWQHPAGLHCFQFNVLKKVNSPSYFYY